MIKEVVKWREDFDLQTTNDGALAMLIEEHSELHLAFREYLENKDEAKAKTLMDNIRKEWADLFFVLIQFGHHLNIDMENAVRVVLKSNYTKRLTMEQFMEQFTTLPESVLVRFADGYVYLYDKETSKLLKPSTYEPAVWE